MPFVIQQRIASSALPIVRSGSDELNLIDFPISLLQYQQPTDEQGKRPDELVCTIESYDPDLDQIVPRKLTRRTASKHGFPTPLDEEVLIALLTLTRHRNNFTSARVHFRHSELFRLMGWENNRRLSIAIDRLKGLNLKYENSWTGGDNRFEKEFTTGLLDSANLVVQTRGKQHCAKYQSWIQWASEIFADIQRGNVKDLDTDRYFAFDLPLARRLYRFLDRHLADNPSFEMDLVTFAAHLGISSDGHIGKIKERLKRAIDSLESLDDFIAPATREQRYTKQRPGQWLVRFQRPEHKSTITPYKKHTSATTRPKKTWSSGATKLVTDFYASWSKDDQHHVTKHEAAQASEIVRRFGEETAHELLPLVIRQLRKTWPDARVFGATMNFWHEAERMRQKREAETSIKPVEPTEAESQKQAKQERIDLLRNQWAAMTEPQKEIVRTRVSKSSSQTVQRFIRENRYDDPLVELACLDEIESNPPAKQ